MAPKTLDEDFRFIMTCIKHSPPAAKPNFDEVAKELGAKSGNACYHRHWAIMKRWGLAGGGVGRARKAAGGSGTTTLPAAPSTTATRKRKGGVGRFNAMIDNTASNDSSSETGGVGSDEAEPSPPAKKARMTKAKKAPVSAIKAEDESDGDTDGAGELEVEGAVVKTEDDAEVDTDGVGFDS